MYSWLAGTPALPLESGEGQMLPGLHFAEEVLAETCWGCCSASASGDQRGTLEACMGALYLHLLSVVLLLSTAVTLTVGQLCRTCGVHKHVAPLVVHETPASHVIMGYVIDIVLRIIKARQLWSSPQQPLHNIMMEGWSCTGLHHTCA